MSNPPRPAGRMPGCLLRSAGAAVSAAVIALVLTQVAFGALLLRLGPFASPSSPASPHPSARVAVASASAAVPLTPASPTISPTRAPSPTPTLAPAADLTANGCAITPDQTAAEQHVLALLNQHRAAAGVRPLALNATLSRVAREHSCDMHLHHYLSHTGSDGSSPFQRIRAAGLTYTAAGENIGTSTGYGLIPGVDSNDSAMMAEPDTCCNHHWNIVAPAYSQVGIGVIYTGGTEWLTEDFLG